MQQNKKTAVIRIKETTSINDRNIATKRLKEMFFTNEDSQDRISIKRAERISKIKHDLEIKERLQTADSELNELKRIKEKGEL